MKERKNKNGEKYSRKNAKCIYQQRHTDTNDEMENGNLIFKI